MATNGTSNLPFKLNDPSLLHQQAYSGGKWVEASSGNRFDIIDPGTGEAWASAPICDANDVDNAMKFAHEAFQKYKKEIPRSRAKKILKWNDLIEANRDDLATVVTYETGKPLFEAQGEITYALSFTWWFTGEAERIQGAVQQPAQPGRRVFTLKQPVGVAAALVPWNFPIAMILRKASAALAAGCTMVIKPSPETPLSVLMLVELANRAGFEPGCLSVLTTDLKKTPELSEAMCKHPLVSKVTFTGSTAVGKLVAKHCSEGLKKVTLELGGNCPFIIFDDADLDQALEQLMGLKWRHAGQACITANRVYVQKGVFKKFEEMLLEKTKTIKVGHGATEGTTMGPVTVPQSIDKTIKQIEDAKKNGGRIVCGGNKPKDLKGYFFEPTILSDMNANMLNFREETFGPICALYPFDSEDEAVKMANDTSMGLASYFFTKNSDRMWRMYENLEAGMIGLNTGNMSAGEIPFGGIKMSGYGKESGKDVAVAEYLVTKTGTMTVQDHY